MILLTGHINKVFPKSLSLCSEISTSLSPHQKSLFLQYMEINRGPQLVNLYKETVKYLVLNEKSVSHSFR